MSEPIYRSDILIIEIFFIEKKVKMDTITYPRLISK